MLDPGEEFRVVIDDHVVSISHTTDAEGAHAIQIDGVNCNLEGAEPGLYYPTSL